MDIMFVSWIGILLLLAVLIIKTRNRVVFLGTVLFILGASEFLTSVEAGIESVDSDDAVSIRQDSQVTGNVSSYRFFDTYSQRSHFSGGGK